VGYGGRSPREFSPDFLMF